MSVRPYGVRMSTVAGVAASARGWRRVPAVGDQLGAVGHLAARPRSTETAVVRGGGSLRPLRRSGSTRSCAYPPSSPGDVIGPPPPPPQEAWSSPKTIES